MSMYVILKTHFVTKRVKDINCMHSVIVTSCIQCDVFLYILIKFHLQNCHVNLHTNNCPYDDVFLMCVHWSEMYNFAVF